MFVTYMYVNTGPRWTFLSTDGVVIIAILIATLAYKRLIPYHIHVLKTNNNIIWNDSEMLISNSRSQSSSSTETYLDDANELLAVV